MAGRGEDRDDRWPAPSRQALTFTFSGLPSPATVTIDLARSARPNWYAFLAIGGRQPVIQIDSGYGSPVTTGAVRIQEQRLEVDLSSVPGPITLTLQVACAGPFLFGWLTVPAEVRSTIETTAERLNIVGAGYWAVPVWEPAWPADGGAGGERPEATATITHQRQSPRLAPERAPEAAEAARSGKDKPSP